ncbi:hypothetical protein Dimus_039519 [Dionaea muscipula]
MMDHMVKAVQEVKSSQEVLTQTLLKFLDDAKKGEESGAPQEQRAKGYQSSFKGGSSSQFDSKAKTTTIQKHQSETLSLQEMRKFSELIKKGHLGKHTSKQDTLHYFLESKRKGEKILRVAKSRKKGYKGQTPSQMDCTNEFLALYQEGAFGPRCEETYNLGWNE